MLYVVSCEFCKTVHNHVIDVCIFCDKERVIVSSVNDPHLPPCISDNPLALYGFDHLIDNGLLAIVIHWVTLEGKALLRSIWPIRCEVPGQSLTALLSKKFKSSTETN